MPTSDRIFYLTGSGQPGFEVEVPQGAPTVENPLGAKEPSHIVVSQVYMQRAAAYRRPTQNSLCPSEISYNRTLYFCDDSPRVPYGVADIVTWTRTWASVPLLYSDYSTVSVIYPGYGTRNVSGGGPALGERAEYSASPRCRIDNEFFLVGPGGRYSSPDAIPSLSENTVVYPADSGTFPSSTFGLLRGGFFIFNAYVTLDASTPTLTTYKSWVTTDSASPSSYSLIVEQSSQEVYIGNIYRRSTIRVKAM